MTSDPTMGDNADQIAYWNDRAGASWTAFQEQIDASFASLTQSVVAAAAPAPGERAIDVGCGCGATLLALAARVGPSGHVLGVDVSQPMAGRALERIAQAGLGNVEVVVTDAAAHEFVPQGADLLFSRFGVMFFADPARAFANLHRAVRPGGRLVFAAWRTLAENPWFFVPRQAAAALLPADPPPTPDAPGPMAFADADRVRRILMQAGWVQVALTPLDLRLRLAPSGDVATAVAFAARIGPLARALIDVDGALRERVLAAVGEALTAHDGPDGIALGGAVWVVTAQA